MRARRASPCCGPPPAAAATREPRPWRRGPRAGAAWLCEERRSWAAAASGAPLRGGRGPASASLPARRRREASRFRHHPSSPGKGQQRDTCSPRAASPVPAAVHLGAGQKSYAWPTLAPGHAETAKRRAATRTRSDVNALSKARLKKARALARGNLLLSQSSRWRRAVTYTRYRESVRARFDRTRANSGGEGLPKGRGSVYGGEGEASSKASAPRCIRGPPPLRRGLTRSLSAGPGKVRVWRGCGRVGS